MVSKSQEEYLKTIYILQKQNGKVRVTDIANKMRLTKAGVCKAVKALKEHGFVNCQVYGTIKLTYEGESLAKKILEKYDIVFIFLRDVIELEEDEAKIEAEKIKLVMSDNTINQLAKYVHETLGFYSLDCGYNVNNEKCRTCLRRKHAEI